MPGSDDAEHGRSQHNLYWTNVYEKSRPRLIAYALVLVNGSLCGAEDLVQEAFCRVLKYSTNPENIKNPLAFLKTIIKRVWSTEWRRERRAITVRLDELFSEDSNKKRSVGEPAIQPDGERNLLNDELRDLISDLKGPLTPHEEELLKLHLEGYSAEEIGEMLGEDVRLVRVELNAVVAKVRYRIMKRVLKKLP